MNTLLLIPRAGRRWLPLQGGRRGARTGREVLGDGGEEVAAEAPPKAPRGKPKIKARPGAEQEAPRVDPLEEYFASGGAGMGEEAKKGREDDGGRGAGALPPDLIPEGGRRKHQLTVDPETAHKNQIEAYDSYREYMKDAMAVAPMTRRRAIIASLPPEELVRRSKEYGVWGSVFTPLDPNNRWKGLVAEARMPKRFRTFRATVVRLALSYSAAFAALGIIWLMMISQYTEYIAAFLKADSTGHTRGFSWVYGLDARNSLLPSELGRPFFPPAGLIEGEADVPMERPPPFRLERWKLEFQNRNESAKKDAQARAAAEEAAAEAAKAEAAKAAAEAATKAASKRVERDGKMWIAL
eukprot:TRINITY_DN12020_c0_g1_i1.p1 TRINITY_DN12020_c0_g1~~TRINITY_DN12020_c0_g1_i1.p1  ORF type:complete len:354 (+),score=128.99 TRINITY_DN12020_c0_g1_i1:123-1184(+)